MKVATLVPKIYKMSNKVLKVLINYKTNQTKPCTIPKLTLLVLVICFGELQVRSLEFAEITTKVPNLSKLKPDLY